MDNLRMTKNERIVLIFAIVAILFILASLCWDEAQAKECAVDDYACTFLTYRQYKCEVDFFDECDPYYIYAQEDETLCKLIVYTYGEGPFVRDVYGQYCYPLERGRVCTALYAGFAAVWTEDDAFPEVMSIYVNTIQTRKFYLPFTVK